MYDYILVGAGSAGCVLANRLTEDHDTRVLLLEAGGPDQKQELHIPAAFSKLFKTPYDWAFYTEEEPHAANRRMYWPRGKVYGGSSSLNAMIYMRGNRRDYDRWRALGNDGWGYEDVLPYFKKSENQERGPSAYHGVGGPLNVADLRYLSPLSRAFVEAATANGMMRRTDDFNGYEQDGAGYYQVTQKQGQRWSAADAYLKPAMKRPNLTVIPQAQVCSLLTEGMRVTGVIYAHGDQLERARAEREVILCGGAVNSPQLLLLSGIGPADTLRRLNIPIVLDLPGVGQNLQDHPAVTVNYASTQPVSLASAESAPNLVNYLVFKRGPLTSNVAEAGAFVRIAPGIDAPDLQFHFAPAYYMEHGFANPPGHGFTFGPTLLRPRSRGSITLRSANPFEQPIIRANYLADEADLRTLMAGVEMSRMLANTSVFDAYRGVEVWPGSGARSDGDIAAYIRRRSETLYHPVGACKMGNDALAVVDSRLRVRGIEGLRVADASIMPEIIGGNTNAPTIMIAEKAADFIKGKTMPRREVAEMVGV